MNPPSGRRREGSSLTPGRPDSRTEYRTSAIDLTATAVAITRNSLDMFGLEADVGEGDAEHLPFPDNSFDGVVSHGVIHHTPDTANCVHEMARVLRRGGIAVVSVYYCNIVFRSPLLTELAAAALRSWVKLPGRGRDELLRSADAKEIVRRYDGSNNPLGKAFTRAQFESMFKAAGFTVLGRSMASGQALLSVFARNMRLPLGILDAVRYSLTSVHFYGFVVSTPSA